MLGCVPVLSLLSYSPGGAASSAVGTASPPPGHPEQTLRSHAHTLAPPPPHTHTCCCVAQEIRRIWLGMLSQCDAGLGQKLAAKLQAAGESAL